MGIDALKGAVFFDRDGVLNDAIVRDGKPYPPQSLSELHIDSSVHACVSAIAREGLVPVIVTNQPDVARGTQRREIVESINAAVASEAGITHVYTCFHDTPDACACRKPKPGLLLQAARDLQLDLRRSYMIGDRRGDIDAGAAAGCTTVFIDRGYAEDSHSLHSDARVDSLVEAVGYILKSERTLHATR